MKKTKLFFTLILLSVLNFSCSKDTSPENPELETTSKLVKSEKISETRNVNYLYNENDLISSLNGIYNNFEYTSNFIYDSENRLTKWNYQESGSSSYSDSYIFTYDSNGLLSNYSGNTQNVTINYNDNIITLTGTIEGNANSQAEIEVNNNGLIIKLTESNQYTKFGYDTDGNMISAHLYDNTDNLLSEFAIQYDNNINPFYGQFESIYIERFIEFFWDFEGIFIGGFEGYDFPFFKNNIISIEKISGGKTLFSYAYDSENYPINVNIDYSGEAVNFDIEYFE
ncbi:hypothetical protein PK35_03835 [Tamlana nanhaiensis]|uniref:DUF4595 domain-containing protein n=1 Tax=Neotamlana nanhaiensis TaxID=1382798 RepID=A0A0D7W467_9FLAO|nr:hypothetical protein [Tamlana nanhaiensis]KJD33881.1 hypothetical protein PK35_03835 [Tamlana nanhaiensis]